MASGPHQEASLDEPMDLHRGGREPGALVEGDEAVLSGGEIGDGGEVGAQPWWGHTEASALSRPERKPPPVLVTRRPANLQRTVTRNRADRADRADRLRAPDVP